MANPTNRKTLVVITGGTIEAGYNPEEVTPFNVPMPPTVEGSAIPELLKKLGGTDDVDCLKLGMTDSKSMAIVGQPLGTKTMIDAILHHAIHKHYDRVIIVQGTDTMPEHAQYLKARIAELADYETSAEHKIFVFTGAMAPLRDKHWHFRDESVSDGWVNMRRALQDVHAQTPGVYVQMGDYVETLQGGHLPEKPVRKFIQGPWRADAIAKHVDTKRHPVTHVEQVVRSGFVVNNPALNQERQF